MQTHNTGTLRCHGTFCYVVALLSILSLPVLPGCTRGHGTAGGAASVEELIDKYKSAHNDRDVYMLRDILWWEAPQAGSGHIEELEESMMSLFDLTLEEVQYVEGPDPETPGGGQVNYVRKRPGNRRQIPGVGGPVYGKLILRGTIGDRRGDIDPCYVVMKSRDRYYIDTHKMVLSDAVTSLRTGRPSQSEPLPLGTDPTTVPRDW